MSKIIEIIDSDEDDSPSSMTNSSNLNSDPNDCLPSRRRPRKSALQVMANPEVQFAVQTIALEDEDNGNDSPQDETTNDNPVRSQQRIAKSTPKILASKPPSMGASIQSAFDEYLNTLRATECIATIALERVRVNYLLSLFGMPEINFSLYTKPDVLKFQFEERLKQQRMMQNVKGESRGRLVTE